MHFPPPTRRTKPPLNLTSIIDVVFLLIIFFMLTSHFIEEQTLRLNIATLAKQDKAAAATPFLITIKPEGERVLQGVTYDEASLRTALQDLLQQDSAAAFLLKPEEY